MPTNLPPPGPERDAELAALLGDGPWSRFVEFSTNAHSCDRLVEEMVRRGWWLQCGRTETWRAWFTSATFPAQGGPLASGTTFADAVSAAALLALRGAQ